MADFAMEMLLGGGGPARASSMRTSSWSDDGQQAARGNAGTTLAGEPHLHVPLVVRSLPPGLCICLPAFGCCQHRVLMVAFLDSTRPSLVSRK